MRRIKVGMVVFPGFQLLDIAGPKDAFAEVSVLSHGECKYEMLTVGTTGGTVLSSSGLAIVPDCTIFDPDPDFDTVIVAGGHGIFDAYDNPALARGSSNNTNAPAASRRSAMASSRLGLRD